MSGKIAILGEGQFDAGNDTDCVEAIKLLQSQDAHIILDFVDHLAHFTVYKNAKYFVEIFPPCFF